MSTIDQPLLAPELNCAITTPVDEHGAIDVGRLARHAHRLFARGVSRIALFGTTGEGPSFTLDERRETLEGLLRAGVDAGRLVVNVGCAAPAEAAALASHAAAAGCSACLVMPPFFFPAPGDEGTFETISMVMERLAGSATRAILYHIPAMTGVPIGPALVARVDATFPGAVEGVKDSDGAIAATLDLIAQVPALRVYVGNEPDLPAALAAGAAGTISGLVNCASTLVADLLAGRDGALEDVRRLQRAVVERPLVPAIKALVGEVHADAGWLRVRAPLSALHADALPGLLADASGLLDVESS